MFIIATVEKYLLTENHLRKIILAGADILRFNFAYRSIEENKSFITSAHQTIDDLNAHTKILIDLPINKVRLGDFELKLFPVNENDELKLKSGLFTFDCYDYLPVNLPYIGDKLSVGQTITIGDGEISIEVIGIVDHETVRVRVQNKGVIQYMKTFNTPTVIDEYEMFNIYTDILEKITGVNFQYLAISYISEQFLNRILDIIKEKNIKAKIIIKIEREITPAQIDKLCQNNNISFVLLDRGELGVNMPYYKLGIYHRQIVKTAQKYKKGIIVSTQLLESTINNYVPNRAEITDLTSHVLSGIQGMMLCRETAINPRAAYTVSVAKKIIDEADKYRLEILANQI